MLKMVAMNIVSSSAQTLSEVLSCGGRLLFRRWAMSLVSGLRSSSVNSSSEMVTLVLDVEMRAAGEESNCF